MTTSLISLPIPLKLGTSGERHCGFLPPRRPTAFAGQLSAGKELKLPICTHSGIQLGICLVACKAAKLTGKSKE